jgi:transposase
LSANSSSRRRLSEEAEKFYRDLAAQAAKVRVGMETSGHARWFERLLAELQMELWIGDAAEIRTKRVRKQKSDRQDAQLLLRLMMEDRMTSPQTDLNPFLDFPILLVRCSDFVTRSKW